MAKDNFRTLLAGLTSFCAFTALDEDDFDTTPEYAAAVLAKIHKNALPRPADHADAYTAAEFAAYHPCAVLFTAEENGFKTQRSEDPQASGRLVLRLYAIVAPANLYDDEPTGTAVDSFEDQVGAIIDELVQESAMEIVTVDLRRGPEWYAPQKALTEGCRIRADVEVAWRGI